MALSNIYQLGTTAIPNLAAIIQYYRTTVTLGGDPPVSMPNGGVVSAEESIYDTTAATFENKGVVIYAETYREIDNSDVSTQLIMAREGDKRWVTDNVAPQPRIWHITGYITAVSLFEPSALFGYTLSTKKKQLMEYRANRIAIWFKTMDSELVQVTIPELEFAPTGEVMNALPLTIKLQEALVLTTDGDDPLKVAATATNDGYTAGGTSPTDNQGFPPNGANGIGTTTSNTDQPIWH
jgi:hypothetical protein